MKQTKWFVLLGIFVSFGLFWYVNSQDHTIEGRNGEFNLTDEVSSDQDVITLNGEWLFYPNALLSPQEVNQEGYDVRVVEVPHSFTEFEYGTYQTSITLPKQELDQLQSFYIPNLNLAYKVWVNDELLVEEGTVSGSRETTKPGKDSHVIDFYTEEQKVTLTVQVSNFYHRTGGIWSEILFGYHEQIGHQRIMNQSLALVVFGSLLVLWIYYIYLYFKQGRDRYHLFFLLVVLALMVRLSLDGEKFFFDWLPHFPWQWAMRLEYLSFIWIAPLFSFAISYMYPKQANFIYTRIYFIGVIIGSSFILFTPSYVFTEYLTVLQATVLFGVIYIFYVIIKAYRARERHAFINLMGMIVLLLTGLNDAFYYNEWVNTEPILSIGFLIFLFIQTIILAIQHGHVIESFKDSSEELKRLNQQLEEKINERTKALEKSQKELLEKNRFLQKISYLDELTQIPNRRSYINVFEKDISEAKENGESIAVLLIDLDLFKNINDRYGHQMGDACLKILAERLNQHFINIGGFVARYGGEEFVAIVRDLDRNQVLVSAEDLRESILRLKVPGITSEELTVSIGVTYEEQVSTLGNLLVKQADEALYRAKELGRNRVCVYPDDVEGIPG
ncbi:sensor domain-containing diguanylate cyclase [Tenuibacillus multivorans]|uniref:Diguanylate cyclase (GGDEF) domain-containing protein n=1 Tax=Tenuibacillus multivorans TaxID=237069 RepID=A0A1H0AUA4_9BACI|nr:diguanylate cyclase [Tenuibacillus multivorans]GEL77815.1 hypothetical protein TMU01_20500 [Tenuibacillus multivorans]SDN37027.1 diguanylate cyclase (GGDEF) domain-containing protein [Tenuibacillus multivorans]